MLHDAPVIARMQTFVRQWEDAADRKAVFLRCYSMMTANMLVAIEQGEFRDRAWVERLLHRFADYYFLALDAYEQERTTAPAVWQLAHDAARDAAALPIQNLLLGVNAHINYDLVLTLSDLLEPEWGTLSAPRRAARYADHCHVNRVIARTIDAVQDEVIEPAMPGMNVLDVLMGPFDEYLIGRLITGWRETVWQNATHLIAARAQGAEGAVIARIEADTLRLGRRIRHGPFARR